MSEKSFAQQIRELQEANSPDLLLASLESIPGQADAKIAEQAEEIVKYKKQLLTLSNRVESLEDIIEATERIHLALKAKAVKQAKRIEELEAAIAGIVDYAQEEINDIGAHCQEGGKLDDKSREWMSRWSEVVAVHNAEPRAPLSPWTPASTPPEEKRDVVMGMRGGEVAVGYLVNGKWYYTDYGAFVCDVTDLIGSIEVWQPLPEYTPAEEEGGEK